MLINTHSYYSLRYGVVSPKDWLSFFKAQPWTHMALTDINNTSACMTALYLLKNEPNKNAVIGDKSALSPGGIRIGLCAMTTRGLKESDIITLSNLIRRTIELGIHLQKDCIKLVDFKKKLDEEKNQLFEIRKDVIEFSKEFIFDYRL